MNLIKLLVLIVFLVVTQISWGQVCNCTVTPTRVNYSIDNSLTFNYIDIQLTGTFLGKERDLGFGAAKDTAFTITLGGNCFYLYGVARTQLNVSTDGYLNTNLTDTGGDFDNDCLPQAPPIADPSKDGDRIFVCHDDKNLTIGGVYHQYFPVSPYQHPNGQSMSADIIQWKGFHNDDPLVTPVDFEVILFENGDIIYQFKENGEEGISSTTGIQSEDDALFTEINCNMGGFIGAGKVYGLSPWGNALANSPCSEVITAIAPIIPTMSEWGLFLFGLLILTLSLLTLRKAYPLLAIEGYQSKSNEFDNKLFVFNKKLYFASFKIALVLALLGFLIIKLIWGTITSDDLIGMAACIPIVAYLIHLWKMD